MWRVAGVLLVVLVAAGCTGPSTARDAAVLPSAGAPEPSAAAGPVVGPSSLCLGRRATEVGTSGPDRVVGTRERDVVVTGAGDDVVVGLAADDLVCTGAGDDTVRSAPRLRPSAIADGADLGAGDDTATFDRAFVLRGGPGDDRIVVRHGPGEVSGGPGDDRLVSREVTAAYGLVQNIPCLDYRRTSGPVRVDLTRGTARGEGRDRVTGFRCVHATRSGDVLAGTPRGDDLEGRGGDDLVRAGAGDDFLVGGAGRDRLYGGDGDDDVYGASGCVLSSGSVGSSGNDDLGDTAGDELFGGAGDDLVLGDLGSDSLDGGSGHDRGQGGYRDGRVDWFFSLEVVLEGRRSCS